MNRHQNEGAGCGDLRDDLLEFAMGTLTGRDRTRLLKHLDGCPQCRREVASLVAGIDTVLALSPEAEPPLGFESRLFARLPQTTVTPRRRHVVRISLAAVLLVIAGFAATEFVVRSGSSVSPSSTRPTTATLRAGQTVLGQVLVSPSNPSWIYMTVHADHWSGVAICQVVLSNGVVETLGRFTLLSGYGSWSAPLKVPGGQVRSARLLDAQGRVFASATFRS